MPATDKSKKTESRISKTPKFIAALSNDAETPRKRSAPKKIKTQYSFCDVAIIGGGAAGVYSAYRLLENKEPGSPGNNVILIEKNGEVGGRLKSQFFDEVPSLPVELGGMRFSENHLLVKEAVNKLGLDCKEFYFDLEGFILKETKVAYGELAAKARSLYILRPDELDKSPEQLIELAIEKNCHVQGFLTKTIDEKNEFIKKQFYNGKHLYQVPWITFLKASLSNEAVSFIRATQGYNSNIDNMSAHEGLKEISQFDGKFHFIKKGYQTLIATMAEEFVKKGGTLKLNATVEKIDKTELDPKTRKKAPYLKKKGMANGDYFVKVENGDDTEEYIFCNKIIVAVPKMAIKKFDQFTDFFDPDKNKSLELLIESIEEMKSLKIYIHFPFDWWSYLNLAKKKIYTDGSIRMAYFLGTEGDENLTNADNRNSVMLVYVDQEAADDFPLAKEILKTASSNIEEPHSALVNFLQRNIEDLVRMYTSKTDVVPNILNIAYLEWDEAYHCYKPYEDARDIISKMIKPVDSYHIYFCGSAYSSKQSWVEGAFLTSEYMLQKHFNIVPLEHIPPGYIDEELFG